MIYNTELLKSNLCHYNNVYILVRGNITIKGDNGAEVAIKNCAPLIKFITKVNGTTIDDIEELDLVMPMHNLLQYSSSYSDTTKSLWLFLKDEPTNFNADIGDNVAFKSFMYKTKLVRKTEAPLTANKNK